MASKEVQALPRLPLERYLGQRRFHRINCGFSDGVQLVHEEPYVFVINDFLAASECEHLVRQMRSAQMHGQMQASATAPGQEERRTSTSMFPGQHDVQVLVCCADHPR